MCTTPVAPALSGSTSLRPVKKKLKKVGENNPLFIDLLTLKMFLKKNSNSHTTALRKILLYTHIMS